MGLIYLLVFIVFLLCGLAFLQITISGIKINDFFQFIKANEILDKLYLFAQKYQKLSTQEQLIFLMEAEKVFSAFEKVPDILWEEDYQKYSRVLDRYKDIKLDRWQKK